MPLSKLFHRRSSQKNEKLLTSASVDASSGSEIKDPIVEVMNDSKNDKDTIKSVSPIEQPQNSMENNSDLEKVADESNAETRDPKNESQIDIRSVEISENSLQDEANSDDMIQQMTDHKKPVQKKPRSRSYQEIGTKPHVTVTRRRKCDSEGKTSNSTDDEGFEDKVVQLREKDLEKVIGQYVNKLIRESIASAVKSVNVDSVCEEIIKNISRSQSESSGSTGYSETIEQKLHTESVSEFADLGMVHTFEDDSLEDEVLNETDNCVEKRDSKASLECYESIESPVPCDQVEDHTQEAIEERRQEEMVEAVEKCDAQEKGPEKMDTSSQKKEAGCETSAHFSANDLENSERTLVDCAPGCEQVEKNHLYETSELEHALITEIGVENVLKNSPPENIMTDDLTETKDNKIFEDFNDVKVKEAKDTSMDGYHADCEESAKDTSMDGYHADCEELAKDTSIDDYHADCEESAKDTSLDGYHADCEESAKDAFMDGYHADFEESASIHSAASESSYEMVKDTKLCAQASVDDTVTSADKGDQDEQKTKKIADAQVNLMAMSGDDFSQLLTTTKTEVETPQDPISDLGENLPEQKESTEDEKKINWKCGYLHVKLPHKTRSKAHLKVWKKRCVAIQPDEFANDPTNPCLVLSVYSGESGAARKHSASFWKCVSGQKAVVYRSSSRTHRYAFTVSDDQKVVVHLSADSEAISQEWMAAIRAILWPPSPVVQLEKMLNGSQFEISIIDNEFSYRAGLLGMYGYLTISPKKLILVHPQQGYVIQEWYLNTIDKFQLIQQSRIEDVNKILSMTTCSDSSTGKGDILIFCKEAVGLLQAIASTIHLLLTYHSKQEGGKYQKELEEIGEWLTNDTPTDQTATEDYYKVPPRQVKSLLDIPNFIFDKPLTPVASVACPVGVAMDTTKPSLDAPKTTPTRASQDSGISSGIGADDFLNCSLTSFVVGGGNFPGKSSDSELSDTYTPPHSPSTPVKHNAEVANAKVTDAKVADAPVT